MISLTKVQLENGIRDILSQENGLNDVLTMTLNGLMFAERDAFLKSDKPSTNKGNGYRYVRGIGFGKELTLSIPRDRLGLFQPLVMAMVRDQEEHLREISFELYGKGLTTEQVGDVIEKIYGRSYSTSYISKINTSFYEQLERWRNRPLSKHYPVIYIDAIQVKVRRETVSSEAFYIVLGVTEEFTREVIGIVNIPSESATGWLEILKEIKGRGVERVDLFVSDGLTSLDNSILEVFPNSEVQKCVTHFNRNVMNRVKPFHKQEVAEDLRKVFAVSTQIDTKIMAIERLSDFCLKWAKLYPYIRDLKKKVDIEMYFTFKNFDPLIRSMIYTTNWIERLNKDFRRTLKIRNALPSEQAALFLITKVAMEKEQKKYSYPIYNFKFEPKFK